MADGVERLNARKKMGPIVRAIRSVERAADTEIHVHVARMGDCKDAFKEASKLFTRFKISETPTRTGVLIYLHLPTKQFAVIADVGLSEVMKAPYWKEFNQIYTEDLRSTHWENATALAVRILGVTLAERLPRSEQNVETA